MRPMLRNHRFLGEEEKWDVERAICPFGSSRDDRNIELHVSWIVLIYLVRCKINSQKLLNPKGNSRN